MPAPIYAVTLSHGGETFSSSADEPVLLAAERAGVQWPSSCRNGTCRTCLAVLDSGHVSYAIEWPGLLPEEKAGGYVLPCVAHAESDLTISAPPV